MAIFGRYRPTAIFISFDPDFSWSWNFQGLFLTILSTISEDLSKIVTVVFEKSSKKHQKMHIFVVGSFKKIFIKNPALLFFLYYRYLTSDRKLEKFIAPLALDPRYKRATFTHTFWVKVANCNVTKWRNSPTENLMTSKVFLTFQLVKIEEMIKNQNFQLFRLF